MSALCGFFYVRLWGFLFGVVFGVVGLGFVVVFGVGVLFGVVLFVLFGGLWFVRCLAGLIVGGAYFGVVFDFLVVVSGVA
ncbi:hypothetical protein, partial [Acinetobacter baumannii]